MYGIKSRLTSKYLIEDAAAVLGYRWQDAQSYPFPNFSAVEAVIAALVGTGLYLRHDLQVVAEREPPSDSG